MIKCEVCTFIAQIAICHWLDSPAQTRATDWANVAMLGFLNKQNVIIYEYATFWKVIICNQNHSDLVLCE